jgi:DNA-binding MarR family transcriptional regulator
MNDQLVSQFMWTAASINAHIEHIYQSYGKALKLSRSQLMILSVLEEHGAGGGMPVKHVAAIVHVDPSFVTQQAKKLEELGLIDRVNSECDARVVLLSLSPDGEKQVATLRTRRDAVRSAAFEMIDERDFQNLNSQLCLLEKRLSKASALLDIEVRSD